MYTVYYIYEFDFHTGGVRLLNRVFDYKKEQKKSHRKEVAGLKENKNEAAGFSVSPAGRSFIERQLSGSFYLLFHFLHRKPCLFL